MNKETATRLLVSAEMMLRECEKEYDAAKQAYLFAGGDLESFSPPIEKARPFHRPYLDAQFVTIRCSELVQVLKRVQLSKPVEYEFTCNRCGKVAQEGKGVKAHCGQMIYPVGHPKYGMFCSGAIIETIKKSS